MTPDDMKRAAAKAALEFVEPGMKLGLGSGSTADSFTGLRAGSAARLSATPKSEARLSASRYLFARLLWMDFAAPMRFVGTLIEANPRGSQSNSSQIFTPDF